MEKLRLQSPYAPGGRESEACAGLLAGSQIGTAVGANAAFRIFVKAENKNRPASLGWVLTLRGSRLAFSATGIAPGVCHLEGPIEQAL